MWEHLDGPSSSLICFAQATPENELSLTQLLVQNPWLIVVGLSLLIPIVAIISGTITDYLRKTRLAEIEAALKHDMLERGMTPDQIKMVVESSATQKSHRRHRACAFTGERGA